MKNAEHRRTFLKAGSLAAAGFVSGAGGAAWAKAADDQAPIVSGKPQSVVSISSANGLRTVQRAVERIEAGVDPAIAVVEGVGIVEADEHDMTVGYGGLPNEHGVVQLDASVMHGPTHKAGSVACIENIMHPAQVALKVLQTTDHVLLVGQGAYEFARAHGFEHENLLTEKARQAWLRWKQSGSNKDDWLNIDQMDWDETGTKYIGRHGQQSGQREIPFTYGTIHCSAVNSDGDVSACTTTSGLSYKIPGRVGDSPIIGAGMYVENDVGAGGATGRGEAVIQSCGSYAIVRAMDAGRSPEEACLEVLRRIVKNSKRQRRLMRDSERPGFNVIMYALRRDGVHGAAAMFPGAKYAVSDHGGARLMPCSSLFS